MIHPERIRVVNDRAVRKGDYVLYWMQQSQRVRFNHALEYAVAVSRGQTIHAADLPEEIIRGRSGPSAPGRTAAVSTSSGPDPSSERERVRASLDAHRWNRAEAARALGMSRTTLWRKMRELGLTG